MSEIQTGGPAEIVVPQRRYRSVGGIVGRICTGSIVATVERVVIADSEHLFYKRASVS